MPKELDLEAVKALAAKLAAGPMTMDQICEHARIAQRTAYRWIGELERRGYDVVRRRQPQGGFAFEILDAPARE